MTIGKPGLVTLILVAAASEGEPRFDAFEKSIPELQEAMRQGAVTSRELVRQYLERIEAFDRRGPRLSSMIFLNPRALEDAVALDRERAERGPRGPLHGIPIILKDNYDTKDMPTTASSVALAGFVPRDDGFQVRKLREAGAVFLGKSNMHELARGITTVSSLGGQTRNPYDPERNPGGSSGGTGAAVAASFGAAGMGSDTCGSIRIPAANNNLFGLRVTQGLSSRDGIIPLSHTQDVGGPLARSVIDLVLILDATVGPDPADPQTALGAGHVPGSYTAFLQPGGLQGARLGLLKSHMKTEAPEKEVTDVVLASVEAMKKLGAEAVEIEIENLASLLEGSGVIGMEFKFDLEDYLAAAGETPVSTLGEILQRGLYHDALGAVFRASNEAVKDTEEYRNALARREELKSALLGAMEEHRLDAIVYPTLRVKPVRGWDTQPGTSCTLSANSGLPAFSLPAGFTPDGVPVGVELLARGFEEPKLISMAFAYEQGAKPRKPPARTPSLVDGRLTASFVVSGDGSVSGVALLDVPTQTLRYELQFADLLPQELVDVKLHRGAPGENGPVVALLGTERRGEVPIRNEELGPLREGNLYLAVYTKRMPLGAGRGQLTASAPGGSR
jgi:Asp-tRNA(Asn)/Glu-tRNA(Gln) amidotransferase A subunit family amidase